MPCPQCGGVTIGGGTGVSCIRRGNASLIGRDVAGCYTLPQIVDSLGVAYPYAPNGDQIIPTAVANRYAETIFSRPGVVVVENPATPTPTFRWYNETGFTWTISQWRLTANVAPVGGPLTFEIWRNGVHLDTRSILAGTKTLAVTGLAFVVASGDYLEAWTTAVGPTTAGAYATIQARGNLT